MLGYKSAEVFENATSLTLYFSRGKNCRETVSQQNHILNPTSIFI